MRICDSVNLIGQKIVCKIEEVGVLPLGYYWFRPYHQPLKFAYPVERDRDIFRVTYRVFPTLIYPFGILRGIRYSGKKVREYPSVFYIKKLKFGGTDASRVHDLAPGTLISYGSLEPIHHNKISEVALYFLSIHAYLHALLFFRPLVYYESNSNNGASYILPSPLSFFPGETYSKTRLFSVCGILLIVNLSQKYYCRNPYVKEKNRMLKHIPWSEFCETRTYVLGVKIIGNKSFVSGVHGPFRLIVDKSTYEKLWRLSKHGKRMVCTFGHVLIEYGDQDIVERPKSSYIRSIKGSYEGSIFLLNMIPYKRELISVPIQGVRDDVASLDL